MPEKIIENLPKNPKPRPNLSEIIQSLKQFKSRFSYILQNDHFLLIVSFQQAVILSMLVRLFFSTPFLTFWRRKTKFGEISLYKHKKLPSPLTRQLRYIILLFLLRFLLVRTLLLLLELVSAHEYDEFFHFLLKLVLIRRSRYELPQLHHLLGNILNLLK